MTYLMHLARRSDPKAVGDDTEMVVLSNRGSFLYVDRAEIQQAEGLGEKVDALLLDMARQVLSAEPEENPQTIAEEFLRGYFEVMEQNPQVYFPSLSYLDRGLRRRPRPRSAPRPHRHPRLNALGKSRRFERPWRQPRRNGERMNPALAAEGRISSHPRVFPQTVKWDIPRCALGSQRWIVASDSNLCPCHPQPVPCPSPAHLDPSHPSKRYNP